MKVIKGKAGMKRAAAITLFLVIFLSRLMASSINQYCRIPVVMDERTDVIVFPPPPPPRQNGSVAFIHKSTLFAQDDGQNFSHCFYRDYKEPPINSCLPLISEVFASYDRSVVYLGLDVRRRCQDKYSKAHDFSASEDGQRQGIQFYCVFEADGSRTLSTRAQRKIKNWDDFLLIQCPVPPHLRESLPVSGSQTTRSYLALESTTDLVTGRNFTESGARRPRLSQLPICSHAWPLETGEPYRIGPKMKYQLAVMTRISLSYLRGHAKKVKNMTLGKDGKRAEKDFERLTITRDQFVPWIEYHLKLGVEHFYIYEDTRDIENSSLRTWCEPYIQRGLITYVRYPYIDVMCDPTKLNGRIHYTGQLQSTNLALRRYQNETIWLGHWDVDEYLAIANVTGPGTLRKFLRQEGRNMDEISLVRPTYGTCKGHPLKRSRIVFEQRQCMRPAKLLGKGIYRTATVGSFRVHSGVLPLEYPLQKMFNKTELLKKKVNPSTAHIAHFQEGLAADGLFVIPSIVFQQTWIHELIEKRIKSLLLPEPRRH